MVSAQRQYSALFRQIDVNKDGKIDLKEMKEALKDRGVERTPYEAEIFFERSDVDNNKTLDENEFITYMLRHEAQIRKAFVDMDQNTDGKIDADEVVEAFTKMGIIINKQEASRLLVRMDSDKSDTIDWEEWRDFLMFRSSANVGDILRYWRHSTVIDIGEDNIIPDDFTEEEMKSGLWWRHLVAGGIAGAISRTATAPLERLKVLLQVYGSSKNLGILSGMRYMVQEGGMRSLWRGNGILVLKMGPDTAIRFMVYEQMKSIIKQGADRELGVHERFLAGSIAGAVSQTLIYPTEVLKTRLCLRTTGQYTGITDCALKIYRAEGIRSFTRGYIPATLSIIPMAGMDLAVYETLKKMYMERYGSSAPNVGVLLGCGTLACVSGQFASYPLQMIRTRLQSQAFTGNTGEDNMTSMIKSIVKKDGFRGLYRGITANLMKMVPAVSIAYVIYEHTRGFMGIESKVT